MRLVNGVGGLLRRLGFRLTLREDRILAKARRWASLAALQRSGLRGWRRVRRLELADDRALRPLRLLLHDIEDDGALTLLGRLLARASLVAPLSVRFELRELREREPEIFEQPVARPLFVIGFARTGTTLLYSLLAQDPRCRAPRLWEAMAPVPPPDPASRRDPRVKRAERLVRMLERVAPGIEVAHAVDPRGPEEDLPLLANAFFNPWHAWFDATAFLEWYSGLSEDEAAAAYEDHRAQLQVLQWRHPGEHWVLKQAGHQFHLGALLRVYPDACLVQTHRDPLVSIPSLCSLAAFYRAVSADAVDLERIGAAGLHAFVEASRRSLAARERADPARFFDLAYDRLLADPVGAVQEIYEHFRLPYDAAFEQAMRRWLEENPARRRGVHRYSLAQFGLERETVERETAFYRERFAGFLPGLARG